MLKVLKKYVKAEQLPKKTNKSGISRQFNQLAELNQSNVFYPVKSKKNLSRATLAFSKAKKNIFKGVFISSAATGKGKAKLKFNKRTGNPRLLQKGVPVREFIPFDDIESLLFNPLEYIAGLVKHYGKNAVFQPFSVEGFLTPLYGDKATIPKIVRDLTYAYDVKLWLSGLRILTTEEKRITKIRKGKFTAPKLRKRGNH